MNTAPPVLTPLRKAAVAIKALRADNEALKNARSAPVAVVGMSCRLPAGSNTPEALWEALSNGRSGSVDVPAGRWNSDALYDPEPGTPGKMYVKKSCFIDSVDQFDPLFFRISPREAIGIDPQQRLLLEVVHEALEDAGIPPPSLVGTRTGVFLGISTNDYSALLSRTEHGSGSNAVAGAGNAASVASGRISYTFGLQGPCFAVDTACSSSLVTAHLAVQSLRNGESDVALVAGVNLMLTPDITINFCQGRMLSPDGLCKTFDERADGYVRGEGCGVLVLKRLDDALAANDRILSVISGSAINQDGKSAGLTAPNGKAQVAVIKRALRDARLEPDAIDFIEAHGTGTSLGDPIEMHALRAVFEGRDRPLGVGSVKTNIGHTEAAAGVSGLIKAVLMLQKQAVPVHPSFQALNSHIELGDLDVDIATEVQHRSLSHIGVSSFGFSGTNAHLVLSRPPVREVATSDGVAGTTPQLLITAQSEAGLLDLIERYKRLFLNAETSFSDVCYSAQVERGRYKWWVSVASPQELQTARPSNDPLPKIPNQSGKRINLPKTPFERKRYWIDGEIRQAATADENSHAGPALSNFADEAQHPLLGRELMLPLSSERRFEGLINTSSDDLAFLLEHKVSEVVVFPGAAYVEMALAARPGRLISDFAFVAPLDLSGSARPIVQFIIGLDDEFRIVGVNPHDTADVQLCASGHYGDPARQPDIAIVPDAADGVAVSQVEFYTNLARHGVEYGPVFQRLDEIIAGNGLASAGLIPLEDNRYQIHPAVLDAGLQLVAAALDDTASETMVPVAIGETVFHHSPGSDARVVASTRRSGGKVEAEVWVSDEKGVAFNLKGILFSPLQPVEDYGFHRVEWVEKPFERDLLSPVAFPQAPAVAAMLVAKSRQLAAEFQVDQYQGAEDALDQAATGFVVAALQQMGMQFEPGHEGSMAALGESLGIADHHRRLFRHLIGFLVDDGILEKTGRRWKVLRRPSGSPADIATLIADHPALASEIRVMQRCGEMLSEVLTGKTDPLTLLFPAESEGAGSFYSDSPYARTVGGLIEAAVRELAGTLQPGQTIRIAEIGAGTGASTQSVLAALDDRPVIYDFTDLSPAFLSAAERNFPIPGLRARRLNIENDPLDQGFQAATADIVIAANVLHATIDIKQSLKHARTLLAPGGMLILVESTAARRWVDIVFGLTEGWWRFGDAELRPDHPLLSSEQWKNVLSEAEFEPGISEGVEVLLARKTAEGEKSRPAAVVSGDGAAKLQARLEKLGLTQAGSGASEHRIHVLAGTPATTTDQTELFVELSNLVAEPNTNGTVSRLTLVAKTNAGHGGLAGFVRSLRLEHPEMRPRLILTDEISDRVLDDIVSDGQEQEIVFDDGKRLVSRITKTTVNDVVASHGTWLISGGAGGLGRSVAQYLAQNGAERLILIGRREPKDMPDFGVPTEFVAGDVADVAFLQQVVDGAEAISGVVHAAGLLANAAIEDQTRETAERVFHAKIGGALALDQATRGMDLDHFILFSTAAGILGAARQANHAFAGSFLDELARQRRSEGLPALSIDWGVWREIGSAARLGFDLHAEELGLGSISPALGVAAFASAIGSRDDSLLVLPGVDFTKVASHFESDVPSLFADVVRPVRPPGIAAGKTKTLNEPRPSSRSGKDGVQELARIVAEILGVDGGVDPKLPLYEYGLDSLVAIEIKNRAEKELGLEIQVRELIEGASISDVAGKLPTTMETAVEPVHGDREQLFDIISDLLGLTAPIDPSLPLFEYGLDSLVAVEIKNRVEKMLGQTLQVRDMIEGASAEQLAAALTLASVPDTGKGRSIKVDPANEHEPFALTDIQQAYWFGRRQDVSFGNVGCYLYTEFDADQIDITRLEEAWNRLILRHGMLRAVIGGEGTQRILQSVPRYEFEVADLTQMPDDAVTDELESLRTKLAGRVAEPEAWPLFDIRVTRHSKLTRIHVGFDLIALDAASIFALRMEWAALYDDLDARLPDIGLSFRDVISEAGEHRNSEAFRRSEAYWFDRGDSLPEGPDLPLAERSADAAPAFHRHRINIDRDMVDMLKKQCSKRSLTLSSVLAAAYADILANWSRDPQFSLTVTSFNRPDLHPDIGALLGDFTSTLLLEVDARADRFADRANTLARRLATDLDHADISGVHVLREMSRRNGGAIRNVPVVFTSALGFRTPGEVAQTDTASWDRLGKTVYNVSSTPQVWIDHQVSEEDGQLLCNWDVLEGMFSAGVIDAMVAAHRKLLRGLATGEAWDWARRAAATRALRAPALPGTQPGMLYDAFTRMAAAVPDAVAVQGADLSLTYRQTHIAASHLAAKLAADLGGFDSTRDKLVAVTLEKGWRQTVAVLAIMMAGAAYLPVDPAWPQERQKQLIELAGASLLKPQWIDAACKRKKPAQLPEICDPDRLAYVIYTSGSTGTPKGVMIEHHAALTTIEAVNGKWDVTGDDRTLALSSLSFDLSVYDIFGPLSVGGAVIVPAVTPQPDPASWSRDLVDGNVTIWNTAPALMALMVEHGLPADHQLRLIMLSGDWVPIDTIRKLRTQAPGATLVALGGATEAAIWSNFHEVGDLDPDWHSIPYGKPLDGHNLHVVARDSADLPDFTVGDIEIAGAGLARGYLGDAERTRERFRTDAHTGERRYVTGDIGRFRPYNTGHRSTANPIEFMGREDFQVKIQGHRIELGEIEHVMEQHDGVSRAIATVFASGSGSEKLLAGFVVPAQTASSGLSFDAAFATACSTLNELGTQVNETAFDQNAAFLTRQTMLAVAAAVRQLSGSKKLPTLDHLIENHGVAPRYRDWLQRTMGLIKAADTGTDAVPSIRELPGDNPFGFGDGDLGLLDTVIENLPDLLTEKKHSADIYMSAQTPDIYGSLFDTPNQIIASILDEISSDKTLQVLEIGAGLGTTFSVLDETLARNNIEYHFTDVSQVMLTLARNKFGARHGVSYWVLDMSLPPQADDRQFDVLIATNALHVAPDIAGTLAATRARLKPGGLLITFEPTRFFPWYDLNMGLQSGFDDRTDRDLRPDHPLLSREDWHAVLQAAEFDRIEIPVAAGTLTDKLGFDIILATAPDVPADDGIGAKEIQSWLSKQLPAYMVPRQICLIDKLPLSANGKVDRSVLQLPDTDRQQAGGGDRGLVFSQLADVVSSCLGTPIADPDKSLFELGATSLSLVALQRQIGERFGRAVPLQAMFEDPTIANLVRIVLGGEAVTSPVIRFSGRAGDDRRPTLMMMPGIFALPFYLKDLAEILKPDVDLVSIQLPGLFAAETPLDTIEAQADHVIARMKQAQPDGPYYIGGHSYGGTIAFEVTRRLRLAGDEVPMVLLGDTLRTRSNLEAFQGDEIAYTAMVRGLLALYSTSLECDESILDSMPAMQAYDQLTAQLSDKGILGPVNLPADRMAAMFKANFKALGQFVPQSLPGDLVLIRTQEGFPPEFHDYEPEDSLLDDTLGWGEFVEGSVKVCPVSGNHLSLMAADTLQETAQIITDLMKTT